MSIEVKNYTIEDVKSDGRVEFWASTKAVDRDGDIIVPGAFDESLQKFMQNPVFLAFHNPFQPAIGKIEEIKKDDKKGYYAKAFFHRKTELSQTLYELYKDGIMKAVSVGFITKEAEQNEHGGRNITKAELLEISAVNVPANPEALSKFQNLIPQYQPFSVKTISGDQKGVVPYKKFPGLPKDRAWDAVKAIQGLRKWAGIDGDNPDWAKFRKGFGWYDSQNPEKIGSYKLPHHEVVDGELRTNFKACIAVISALNGARGGVDIPEEDRKNVYSHVAKHLKDEWDYEAPELRDVSIYTVANLLYALNEKVDALISDMRPDQPQDQFQGDDDENIDFESIREELKQLRNLFKGGRNA